MQEMHAVYLATLEDRTPSYARAVVVIVVAYAASPIDQIPDFIPVLGYLDDLVIVPAGVARALKVIPAEVMAVARQNALTNPKGRGLRVVGAVIIGLTWLTAIVVFVLLVRAPRRQR